MGKPRNDPLQQVTFRCGFCGHQWESAPERVEDCDDQPWHPWRYGCACPVCDHDAGQVAWERALLKAHANATGPRTPEGMAATSANLEGHPTPEEAKRTRFNSLKHGLFARTANYFPARPGKYPHCESCEHLNNGCDEYPLPGHRNPPACLKRTELFMRHQIAFESRDPGMLASLRSDTQAALQAIIDDIILAIASRGVELRAPEYWVDYKSGSCGIVDFTDPESGRREVIYKTTANPLLKPLIDLIQKNNLTLSDMGMTPKVQEEQELVRGALDARDQDRESMDDFQRRQQQLLEQLSDQVQRSQKRLESDPVLIEHRRNEGG